MYVRRRRPMMRAAMLGGAGYAAGKRAARGQAQEAEQEERLAALEQQQAQPAPPAPAAAAPAPAAPAAPAAAGGDDVVTKLTQLKGLLDAGVLSPDEFEAAKQKVLQGG